MWSQFWTDFNAAPAWRFPEVPPWEIQAYLGTPVVNHWESVRAEWLWQRRPKEFLGDDTIGCVLLVAISILLLLVPVIGIFLDAAWLLSSFLLIALDVVRNVRWRRDYEASLCRLVRTMRSRESI